MKNARHSAALLGLLGSCLTWGCQDPYVRVAEETRAELRQLALPVTSISGLTPMSPMPRVVVRRDGIDIDNAEVVAAMSREDRQQWLDSHDFTSPLVIRERNLVGLKVGRITGVDALDHDGIRPLEQAMAGIREVSRISRPDHPLPAVAFLIESDVPMDTVRRTTMTVAAAQPYYGVATPSGGRWLALLGGRLSTQRGMPPGIASSCPLRPGDPLEVVDAAVIGVSIGPQGFALRVKARGDFRGGGDSTCHARYPSWHNRWAKSETDACPLVPRNQGRLDLGALSGLVASLRRLSKHWEIFVRSTDDTPWGEVISVVDTIWRDGDEPQALLWPVGDPDCDVEAIVIGRDKLVLEPPAHGTPEDREAERLQRELDRLDLATVRSLGSGP